MGQKSRHELQDHMSERIPALWFQFQCRSPSLHRLSDRAVRLLVIILIFMHVYDVYTYIALIFFI